MAAAYPDPDIDNAVDDDDEDDEGQLGRLVDIFPDVDPEFLDQKVKEFGNNEVGLARWIEGILDDEKAAADLPTRADYEKRQQEMEMVEKYTLDQVTVEEILKMYDNDPESFFMNKNRKVSYLYETLTIAHLRKEFRFMTVAAINKVFCANGGLFLPCFRALTRYVGGKRKTMRTVKEINIPTEIDIEFLKELQYSRLAPFVRLHLEQLSKEREEKIESARTNKTFRVCDCCGNDECLDEDMLPCSKGHFYCKDCIQRASDVAIGEGKTGLKCLIHCDSAFDLCTLQKALGANTFSKWMMKIQLAEVEKAKIDGLEQCPFCPFATIMEVTKESNKIFECLNPECGKDSCRLCGELSHIPLSCDQNKTSTHTRTYIENKMAEAMIRNCYNCNMPYIKMEGCNKITCSTCGKQMCYLCREPVKGYDHFAGQGSEHTDRCPLWSDNIHELHDRDVALGAKTAKAELEQLQRLEDSAKNEPVAGLEIQQVGPDEKEVAKMKIAAKKKMEERLAERARADAEFDKEMEKNLEARRARMANQRNNNNIHDRDRAKAETNNQQAGVDLTQNPIAGFELQHDDEMAPTGADLWAEIERENALIKQDMNDIEGIETYGAGRAVHPLEPVSLTEKIKRMNDRRVRVDMLQNKLRENRRLWHWDLD